MAQNNLFMDDDDMRLYIDVQPLFIDELENSKNSAAASALRAAQSEEAARGWKNDIEDYKTGLELFYARATDGITNSYNTSISGLSAAKNSAISDLTLQKNSIQTNLNNSLNSAIVSIRTNGQSYVNQAQYYAEEAQRTVDNRVSTDHLNQSKGLLTGFVSTDEEVFADVQKYAHSTFDRSKFTVVGSPNITADGIASGFSSSNYLQTGVSLGAKPFEIRIPFKIDDTYINANHPLFVINGGSYQNYLNFNGANPIPAIQLKTVGDINSFYYFQPIDGSAFNITLDLNKKYVLIFGWDGTKYYGYIYLDKIKIGQFEVNSSDALDFSTNNYIILGKGFGGYFTGSIDLKQFSITVDGVEVFNGNKTGIDTIKPDDYTVVGTPTISADGVASGMNATDTSIRLTSWDSTKPWELEIPVFLTESGSSQIFNGSYGRWAQINTNNTTPFRIILGADSVQDLFFDFEGGNRLIPLNEWYIINVSYDGVNSMTYKDKPLGASLWRQTLTKTTNYAFQVGSYLLLVLAKGSIDLNLVKIYVDGNLVYQPCLKIPYTESKTGSKIVDSIYRDRVNDMAEQFGYANYYTLDEDNSNFTLPKGEVYGMIEKLRELIIQRTS